MHGNGQQPTDGETDMTITTTAAVEAFRKGAEAAAAMLRPGNVFQGAYQVADSLFARISPEWEFAVRGAYIEIQHYAPGIWTDAEGRITR
jgi:hypothetical protein